MDKLTYREIEIINHTACGLTAKEIAKEIGLEYRTVEIYMQNLRKKLGAKNAAHTIYLYFCKITAAHLATGREHHDLSTPHPALRATFSHKGRRL